LFKNIRKLKYEQLNFYKNRIVIYIIENSKNDNIFLYNKKLSFHIYFMNNNECYPFGANINELNDEKNFINLKEKLIKGKLKLGLYKNQANSNNKYLYPSTNKFLLAYINNIIDLSKFFFNCSYLINIDLSNLDISNVTNISYMFYGCSSLEKIILPNKFNTSQVTNMEYMFNGCNSLISLDLSNFDTSNVTNMSYMFYDCSSLKEIKLTIQVK